jgi:hypothetical protein
MAIEAVVFDRGGTLSTYVNAELVDAWRLAARHLAPGPRGRGDGAPRRGGRGAHPDAVIERLPELLPLVDASA